MGATEGGEAGERGEDEHTAGAAVANGGVDCDLRDVADGAGGELGDVGEDQAEQAGAGTVGEKKAGRGVKETAGGVAEDIGDVGAGAGEGAVLVVNRSVDVVAVGEEEELS